MADDAGFPAHARPHQQGVVAVLDLKDLGALRPHRLTDKATDFGQNIIEIVAAQGEVAEIGKHPLSPDRLFEIRHAINPP